MYDVAFHALFLETGAPFGGYRCHGKGRAEDLIELRQRTKKSEELVGSFLQTRLVNKARSTDMFCLNELGRVRVGWPKVRLSNVIRCIVNNLNTGVRRVLHGMTLAGDGFERQQVCQ